MRMQIVLVIQTSHLTKYKISNECYATSLQVLEGGNIFNIDKHY